MTAPAALQELVDFHVAVQRWFGDRSADEHLDRMTAALDPTFRRIGPDGTLQDRDGTITMLRAARGCHASSSPPFIVAINEPRILWTEGLRILTLYVETQLCDGTITRRRALAAFRVSPTAPCGVLWTELAETWIPH